MKRTKRYGGFLIGDRVRVKDNAKTSCKGSGKVIAYNGPMLVVESYPMKGMIHEFAPRQLINLTRIEEERTNVGIGIIPPKTKLVVLEDLPATPFEDKVIGNIQEARLKLAKLQDKELKAERDFVDEALRQTEIFLSPLSPYGDPLPSPYTRDVYTSTLDYPLSM